MAVMENAADAIPEESRSVYSRTVFDVLAHFAIAGFVPERLDLRDYFGRTRELAQFLSGFEAIYACGGNAFVLRRAMRLSGFDIVLPELLDRGVVYGGWSAGSCVAGDSLQVIEPMDEPEAIGIGHPPGAPVFEGLGLLSFGIIPHVRSNHPESELADVCIERARRVGLAYRSLRDGQAIVLDGAKEEIVGTAI